MTDEYIITDNGIIFFFLKNGYLHREDGPAILLKGNNNIDDFLTPDEKEIYTIKPMEENQEKPPQHHVNYLKYNQNPFYMLDGHPFSKEEFDLEVKKIQTERMQNQLNKELVTKTANIKKTKI